MPAYSPQSTASLHVKLGTVDNAAVLLSGSAHLNASLAFTAADVGAQILVFGGAAVKVISTVLSVTDSTHAVLNDPASGDISPGSAIIFRPYKCRTDTAITINNALGVKDAATFTIQSLDGSFRPIRGQNVLITDDVLGDLFGGIVDSVVANNVPGSPAVWSDCACVGFDYLLYKRTAGTLTGSGTPPNPDGGVFTGMTAGDIIAYLVLHACGAEGLSTNAIAGPTVDTVTFDYSFTVGSAMDSLVQLINGTASDIYYFVVDAWRTVQFAKMSTIAAPWNISTLDGSDANVLIQVANTTDGAKLANRCYINEGMYIADAIEEDFTGDGTTRTWDVTDAPIAATPLITLDLGAGPVPMTVGVDGKDTGKDYYWTLNSKTIRQDSGATVLPAPMGVWPGVPPTLAVTYQGFVEKVIGPSSLLPSLTNQPSIDARSSVEGGTGYYDTYVSVSTPSTLAGGTSLGASLVQYFGDVPSKVDITSYRGGLRPGQSITVNLPEIGVALDCSNNLMLWTYELYAGALIGGYLQALKNLTNGGSMQATSGAVGSGIGSPGHPGVVIVPGVPGIVSFSPKRTNYGELSVQDIVVRDADPVDTPGLHIYAAYVDETRISQYATMSGGMTYDPDHPDDNNVVTISVDEHDVGVEQWGDFKAGDFAIVNDTDVDYVSPAIGSAAWACLTADVTAAATTFHVGIPSSITMPVSGAFSALVDAELVDVTAAVAVRVSGVLTGYTWTVTRHASGTTAAAHVSGAIAYHLTNLNLRKYEIFLITAIGDAGWTIQRHYPGDAPGRAMFGSWMSSHSGKKIFKLQLKHFADDPRSADASVMPPAIVVPGRAGGSSVVIPSYTAQLPHACVAALLVAAANASGAGPYTTYNCAQFDNFSDSALPVLPGIRTMDGSSYTFPQFKGPIFNGLTIPIPWACQVWAACRCVYAYVGQAAVPINGTGITKLQLQMRCLDDGDDTSGKPIWNVVSKMQIDSGKTQSWDWPDPNPGALGPFPPPTLYNNPYFKESTDETTDEYDWPQWSHPQGGSPLYHRCLEGDALLRWIVTDNGSIPPTAMLAADVTDRTNVITISSYTAGFANGDYIQIDDEILQIQYDGGTLAITALRGVLGTIPAAHLAEAMVSDISAGGAVDLSVCLQT